MTPAPTCQPSIVDRLRTKPRNVTEARLTMEEAADYIALLKAQADNFDDDADLLKSRIETLEVRVKIGRAHV